MKVKPETKLGKWSVRLNISFLIIIFTSIILVKVLGILYFDDRWWDITVPVAFLIEMIAFFTGIRAVGKNKEHSLMVYLSILTGVCVILFVVFHGLFIND